MSTKRQAPSKASRAGTSTGPKTQRSTVTQKLEPEEERAVRMRYGLGVADDHPLDQKHGGRPDVMAKLKEIERRAFERTNRVELLKQLAGVGEEEAEETPRPRAKPATSTKQKIVDKLKTKAGGARKSAEVTAGAKPAARSTPSTKKKR